MSQPGRLYAAAEAHQQPEEEVMTLPPKYWATFVLSGDWR
jgi:hypothetical protein